MSYLLKTIIGVALIEAILLVVLIWNSIEILTKSVEDGLTKRAVTTTHLFADVAKDAVISSNISTLGSLVNKLTKNPDLTYVRVLGPNNVVLAKASTQSHSIPSSFKADSSYKRTDDGVYDVFTEITEAGKKYGRVEIGFSIAPLTATVEKAQRNAISIAIAEIILVALFSFGLGLHLTRQLRQLTRASGQIAKGEFDYQLEVRGKDELAETASAFNTMSRQVSSLYDQVVEDGKRSRTTIDACLDAIIEIDQHRRIVEFNPAAETIFGYSRETAIGAPFTETIIPERLRNANLNGVENWLKSGTGTALGARLELPAIRADGEEFPAEVSIHAKSTTTGPIFIAYIRDITEQKSAEAKLLEAKNRAEAENAVKSKFLAMMSHEIRTPINAVIGSLSLLQDTQLDGEQSSLTYTGRRSSEALLGIINDILDFSKMEAGKFIFDDAPLKISDIVDTVLVIVAPQVRDKRISIKTHISEHMPRHLIGDESRVRQVLLNLAGNAVKFTDTGSVAIEVSLTAESEHDATIHFDVLDTGIGISTEHHSQLFNDFTTLTPEYTQKYGGTGLGLAISKTLVDLMEGDIGFDSLLGQGSRFWFTVKLRKLSPDAIKAMEAEAKITANLVTDFTGTILLVEDNPANRLVTQTVLEKAGVRVDIASNGFEALAAVRRRPYDLILMDIGMPELDGVGATAEIRKLDTDRARTPIVAMTAHVMHGDRSKFLAHGMDGYLAKPASREQILTCIVEWLQPDAPKLAQQEALPPLNITTGKNKFETLTTATLVQLVEDTDINLLPQLIDTFINTAKQQIESITLAASEVDFQKITASAHSLKSSSATFGALHLNELVKSIETAVKENDHALLNITVPLMKVEALNVYEKLKKYAEDNCSK